MNVKQSIRKAKVAVGFTLLEVVLALGMMSLLVGVVFQLASTSIIISQTVVEEQNATMERNAFFSLLRNHFEQIPGNAIMAMNTTEVRQGDITRDLFTLTFQNVPMAFDWGEAPLTAEALQLATVPGNDGFVNVVLRFYDVKILEDPNSREEVDVDAEPVAEITIIEDLWLCDCEAIEADSLNALTEWDDNSRLPLQVKLYCRFSKDSDIVQQTFWVVKKVNTAIYFRNLAQSTGSNGAEQRAGDQRNRGGDNPNQGNGDQPAANTNADQ